MREGVDRGHIVYTAETRSRTRPPAVLHACTEARKVALTIYIEWFEKVCNQRWGPYPPIYLNPMIDITYRGRQSEPFGIFCPNFTTDVIPLGATRTLAVDARVLEYDPMCKPLETKPNLVRQMGLARQSLVALHCSPIAQQIMACSRQGVEDLILVVGNDERVAEFELDEVDETSDRAKEALAKADNLCRAIHEVWHRSGSNMNAKPPAIKVVTVKRKPIKNFHLFSKFPQEIQNMVWDFASQSP